MKKSILYIAAACALLAGCKTTETTVVNGIIIGYNGEFTEFFIPNEKTGNYDEYVAEVAPDGTFTMELKMDKDWLEAPFFVDKFLFRTCIQKGKTYNATFDVTVPDVENNYRFEGEGEKENEFTNAYYNGFSYATDFFGTDYVPQSFEAHKARVDAGKAEIMALLEATGNDAVIRFYTPKVEETANIYSYYYPYLALARDGEFAGESAYDAFLKDNGTDKLTDAVYKSLMTSVTAFAAGMDNLDIEKAVVLAGSTSSQKDRNDYAMTELLKYYMMYGSSPRVKEAFGYYLANCENEEYKASLEEQYKAFEMLVAGNEAPEIEMEDPDGNVVLLSSLRGKALYIDFWATWCGPCQGEIPYMAKLAEQYKGNKDVLLVSISLDQDKEAWKAQIADEKPIWPQYVLTEKGQSDVANVYKINSIPRFMLLDKDGLVVSPNAQRPSAAAVNDEIASAIK